MKYRGVIIGVNGSRGEPSLPPLRYAAQDAEDVYAVLTDPGTGMFNPDDVDLLVGEDATASQTKKTLRRRVNQTESDDLLLVYFSGHAFVPSWSRTGEAYLGTHDLDVEELAEEPDIGLRMSFLRHDIFDLTRGASILLLDCCLANEYLSARSVPVGSSGLQGGHAALLAYSPDATAKEKASLAPGEFTAALLAAFRDHEAGPGPLTMEGLYQFLLRRLAWNPTYEVRKGGVYEPLTKARPLPVDPSDLAPQAPAALSQFWESQPPLAVSMPVIQDYVKQLLDSLPHVDSAETIGLLFYLDAVRRSVGGDQALIVRLDGAQLRVEASTDTPADAGLSPALAQLARRAIDTKFTALSHLA